MKKGLFRRFLTTRSGPTDGRMDGWMDGWMDGQTLRCEDASKNGLPMDGPTDRRTDIWTNEKKIRKDTEDSIFF